MGAAWPPTLARKTYQTLKGAPLAEVSTSCGWVRGTPARGCANRGLITLESSSMRIHPTAIVHAGAKLAPDVQIGAFASGLGRDACRSHAPRTIWR